MSEDIIFDKISIQLSHEQFFTFILIGNSRTYDVYTNGVERNWKLLRSNWHGSYLKDRTHPWGTVDEFKSSLESEHSVFYRKMVVKGEAYSPKDWGSHFSMRMASGPMSFGQYKGLWVGAARKSITISRLKRVFQAQIKLSIKDDSKTGVKAVVRYPKNGMEFMLIYNQFLAKVKGPSDIHVELIGRVDLAKRIRKRFYTKKTVTQYFHVDHYFTVEVDEGYFKRLTKTGYLYTEFPGLKFETKEQAERKVEYLRRKRKSVHFEVKKILAPAKLSRQVAA